MSLVGARLGALVSSSGTNKLGVVLEAAEGFILEETAPKLRQKALVSPFFAGLAGHTIIRAIKTQKEEIAEEV
jgi:hypothetical protein